MESNEPEVTNWTKSNTIECNLTQSHDWVRSNSHKIFGAVECNQMFH